MKYQNSMKRTYNKPNNVILPTGIETYFKLNKDTGNYRVEVIDKNDKQ
jgi:hypothetical protein